MDPKLLVRLLSRPSHIFFGNLGVGSEAFEAALKEFEVDSDTFEITFKAFEAVS